MISINRLGVIAFLFAVVSGMLFLENRELHKAISQFDQGYIEFMERQVKGKAMSSYVKPQSVGLFKIGEDVVACGMVHPSLLSQSAQVQK